MTNEKKEYPFIIGRRRRMKDSNDELAIQEILSQFKKMFTAGLSKPDKDIPGPFYVQYSSSEVDSYTRLWYKKQDGTWSGYR